MSHSRVVRKESEKKEIEKEMLAKVLMNLLRDEENRYCADCEAKGPRWASWNIGIFVCIRCAGIHRKLGVHISKVKSINLDSWTPEQVVSMCGMGNSVAKAVYEHSLPDHFRKPQSDSALEAFIRSKYEQKRYMMKDWQKPEVDIRNLPCYNELIELRNNGTVRVRTSAPTTPVSSINIPPPSGNSRPSQSPSQSGFVDLNRAVPKPAQHASTMNDLLGLDAPIAQPTPQVTTQESSGIEDLFGDFTAPQQSMQMSQRLPTQVESTPHGAKSNNDILALFATAPMPPNGMYTIPQNSQMLGGLNTQMQGMSMQSPYQQAAALYQQASPYQQAPMYSHHATMGMPQQPQPYGPAHLQTSAVPHHDLPQISPGAAPKPKAPISDSAFKDIMSSGFFNNISTPSLTTPTTSAQTATKAPQVSTNELVDLFG